MSYQEFLNEIVAWEIDGNVSAAEKALHIGRRIILIDYSLFVIGKKPINQITFQVGFINPAGGSELLLQQKLLELSSNLGEQSALSQIVCAYKPKLRTKASYEKLFKADPKWEEIKQYLDKLNELIASWEKDI